MKLSYLNLAYSPGLVDVRCPQIFFLPQKILVHSKSRVVLKAMEHAVSLHKQFQVFVTYSSLDSSG